MPFDALYTPQTLGAVIQRTPDLPSFLKDKFFSNMKTFHTASIAFDVKKGRRTITPFVTPLAAAPVAGRTGFKTLTYTPAMKKEKTVLQGLDLDTRLAGEQPFNSGVTPAERAVQYLAEDAKDLKDNLIRSQEAMAADLLFTGSLHVKGDDVDDVVDFGFTNKETLSGGALWSNPDADIIGDLLRWRANCRKASGFSPNTIIADTNTINAILTNKRILELLDNRSVDFGRASTQDLGDGAEYHGYLAGILGVNLYAYDNWYVDPVDGVEKSLVPEKTICFIPENAQFSRLYGAITLKPNITSDFVTYEGEYVLRRLDQQDPDATYLEIQSRPLYVPWDVDAFQIATVL